MDVNKARQMLSLWSKSTVVVESQITKPAAEADIDKIIRRTIISLMETPGATEMYIDRLINQYTGESKSPKPKVNKESIISASSGANNNNN